jgi:deoxyguanosine kinase
MPGWHIAVSGLVGSGKTTLVKGLARGLGGTALVERDSENPFLAGFYQDPPTWAFKSFVFFLLQTLEDYRGARVDSPGAIQERVLEEHLVVFAEEFRRRGYLSADDLEVLRGLTTTAASLVPPPDLLIHLELDPAEALRRMRQRGNAAEEGVALEYLEALNERYAQLLSTWEGKVLKVDSASHDFRDDGEVANLASVVRERLPGVGVL